MRVLEFSEHGLRNDEAAKERGQDIGVPQEDKVAQGSIIREHQHY